jgi:hypothetical protein
LKFEHYDLAITVVEFLIMDFWEDILH